MESRDEIRTTAYLAITNRDTEEVSESSFIIMFKHSPCVAVFFLALSISKEISEEHDDDDNDGEEDVAHVTSSSVILFHWASHFLWLVRFDYSTLANNDDMIEARQMLRNHEFDLNERWKELCFALIIIMFQCDSHTHTQCVPAKLNTSVPAHISSLNKWCWWLLNELPRCLMLITLSCMPDASSYFMFVALSSLLPFLLLLWWWLLLSFLVSYSLGSIVLVETILILMVNYLRRFHLAAFDIDRAHFFPLSRKLSVASPFKCFQEREWKKTNPKKKLSNFEFVLLQPIQWPIIYFVNFVLIVPRASANSTVATLNEQMIWKVAWFFRFVILFVTIYLQIVIEIVSSIDCGSCLIRPPSQQI